MIVALAFGMSLEHELEQVPTHVPKLYRLQLLINAKIVQVLLLLLLLHHRRHLI